MLTTFRLDQTLKNRINALPLLSAKAKSFSHALRYLVYLGLTRGSSTGPLMVNSFMWPSIRNVGNNSWISK